MRAASEVGREQGSRRCWWRESQLSVACTRYRYSAECGLYSVPLLSCPALSEAVPI